MVAVMAAHSYNYNHRSIQVIYKTRVAFNVIFCSKLKIKRIETFKDKYILLDISIAIYLPINTILQKVF